MNLTDKPFLTGSRSNSSWLVGLLFLFGNTLFGYAMTAQAEQTAIVGATVHTVTQAEPVVNATILIEDGVITALGKDVSVPLGYAVVEAAGKQVTPGIIESYSQLGLEEVGAIRSSVDSRLESVSVGAAFDVQYGVNPGSTLLAVNLMEGVTHAVTAPQVGPSLFAGQGAVIDLSKGKVILPRAAVFASASARASILVGGSRAEVIGYLRQVMTDLASFNPRRYEPAEGQLPKRDMIALKTMQRTGQPLVVEVHRANEIRELVKLAQAFDLNLVLRGAAEAWQVADLLAANSIPVIVDVLGNIPDDFDQLGARMDNAAMLTAAGVQVLFTVNDSHRARQLRQYAGNAVAEGMAPHAALAAMTANVARAFGLPEKVGTVQVGAPANLVVWNGDPLELSTWPEHVFVDGVSVSLESRQTRLFKRYVDLEAGKASGFSYQ